MPQPIDARALLDALVAKARRAGADAADAVLFEGVSLSHAQRLGNTEKLERSESYDLGLRVLIGKRQAIVSSNDRGAERFDELVARAIAMAKAVPEDPYCGLASPDEIARSWPDLDMVDPAEPTPETLVTRATAAEEAARAVPGVTNSEGAEASWGRSRVMLVASNGFVGGYAGTGHSVSVSVLGGEGIGNARRAIIEDGVLTTWLLDLASARQLGLRSTGHAARGTSSPPGPSPNNLWLEPGPITAGELIGDIDKGFYVTELMGMGVNAVTGDYSRGAAGFWIERGKLAYPVSEVTVAGNLKDMFQHLAAASDLEFKTGIDAPTLRVDGMTVAGA